MIVLEIHRSEGEEVQIFTSDKRLVTLGRHSSNDIRLEEEAVSRFHAEIEDRDGHYFIRDLDSRNGLHVNRSPVLEHPLSTGDEIRVGSARLIFHPQDVRSSHDSSITQVITFYPPEEGRQASPSSAEGVMDMPVPARLTRELIDSLESEVGKSEGDRKALLRRSVVGIELGLLIARTAELDMLLQETLISLARIVRFTRGVILIWDEEKRTYRPRAIYQDSAGDPDHTPIEAVPVSMTIVNQCLERRQGVCCVDAMSDPRFATSDSIFDLRLRSVICVPIRGSEQDLGVIQVDSPSSKDGVRESDLPVMMLAANLLASGIQTRLVQEQRQKRARRGDEARVLAAASHCLHSIFMMNEGQIETLRQAATSGDSELMTTAVDQFFEGQRSLDRLIEGLYDYVRGRVQAFARVQVNDILAGLLDELAPTLDTKGIEMEFLREESLPSGYFDRAALRLLFLNILINAIESLEGIDRPMIHLTTERERKSRITIRIQDNGRGMGTEVREKLFTPFFTTKGRAHAGLGLTYASHIVAAHDGRIDCESEPSLGTTVTVRFPVRTTPPVAKPSTSDVTSSAPWLLEG